MDRRWTEASLLVSAELPLAEAGCRQHAGMGTLSCVAGCAGRVWVEGGDGSCLPGSGLPVLSFRELLPLPKSQPVGSLGC